MNSNSWRSPVGQKTNVQIGHMSALAIILSSLNLDFSLSLHAGIIYMRVFNFMFSSHVLS
jgi:hypothetical protein